MSFAILRARPLVFLLALPALSLGCLDEGPYDPPPIGGGDGGAGQLPGDGGDDDGGDEGGGGGGDGGEACGTEDFDFRFEIAHPSVMLVLDKSRSMTQLWDHDGDPGTGAVMRWTSLHDVVERVTLELDADVDFEAALFPSMQAESDSAQLACLVEPSPEVPVAPHNADGVLAGIPAADDSSIEGGTPATAGVANAFDELGALEGQRAMVLVTDGAANCMAGVPWWDLGKVYDTNLAPTVELAFKNGIPTYVVGINIVDEWIADPVVNCFDALNEVADAGGVSRDGVERFYGVDDEGELEAAMRDIGERIQCTVALETSPDYPEEVLVLLGGEKLLPVEDCDTEDGWRFTSEGVDIMAIELCGQACEDLQTEMAIRVVYECPDE